MPLSLLSLQEGTELMKSASRDIGIRGTEPVDLVMRERHPFRAIPALDVVGGLVVDDLGFKTASHFGADWSRPELRRDSEVKRDEIGRGAHGLKDTTLRPIALHEAAAIPVSLQEAR